MNIDKLEMPAKNTADYDAASASIAASVNLTQAKPQVNNLENTNNSNGANAKDKDGNEQDKESRVLSKETLKSAFSNMNAKLKAQRTRCEYEYDEATNRVSIKVYDKDTNEVILEAPPEDAIEALKKTLEVAGILVDKKS